MTRQRPPGFEEQFSAALAHLNAGRLEAAAAASALLRRAAPNDPAVLQLHATLALRTDQPAEALQSIRRSLAVRPGHVPTLILAARAARATQALDQALEPLREAIGRAPDLAEPAFLLCLTLLELNDPSLPEALADLAKRHPAAASEWQQLGRALHRAGRPGMALAAFTRAAAADPAQADAHFGRGLILREAGRMTDGLAALQQAVTLDPGASGAWFALGLTCQDLGDEAGAADAFEAALQARADFAEAAVNHGIALQRLGDMPGAIAAYRRAVRIRPDTFGRIAQAITSARTGMLWLDIAGLRRLLGA